MAKSSPGSPNYLKLIDEVSTTKNWKLLEQLENRDAVDGLAHKDKQKLAQLFFEKGRSLIQEDQQGSLAQSAINAFEMALRLDPTYGEVWLELAAVHLKQGIAKQETACLEQAQEIFSHAETIFRCQGLKLPLESLWNWGAAYYFSAKESEEALDLKLAIEKFQEAYELGLQEPGFFIDYGSALAELGVLVGRVELIIEATEFFERSLKEYGDHPAAWLRLACAYKFLYFLSGEALFFEKADQSFLAAARQNSTNIVLWLNWGQLLTHEAKSMHDSELLQSGIEKLEKAEQLQPNEAVVLCSLADALMHLGTFEDNLDYLKLAKEKLQSAIAIDGENQEIVCLMGHCELHIGKYFSDAAIVQQAIEKFQQGLSANKNSSALWHGLASAHYLLGDLNQAPNEFEKAAKFCSQAIKTGGNQNSQYWNDWGVALMKIGDILQDSRYMASAVEKFEEAINAYTRKQSGYPDPEWFYNYGCALDYLGDFQTNPQYYEKAIAVLSKLLDQYPQMNHVRYNLALAFYHLGDATGEIEFLEKAIDLFEELLREEKEDETLFNDLGLTVLTLADLLRDSIHLQRAEEAFKRAEQILFQALASGSQVANYYLACLYSLTEQYPDAMHFLERAKANSALPPLDDLLQDEWLEALRYTPHFRAFLATLTEDSE